jgi:hypothetical protein
MAKIGLDFQCLPTTSFCYTPMNKIIFTSIVTNNFWPGFAALTQSIFENSELTSDEYEFLVICDVHNAPISWLKSRKEKIHLHSISTLPDIPVLTPQSQGKRMEIALQKLGIFMLPQSDGVLVYIDADMICLSSLRDLFNFKPIVAAYDGFYDVNASAQNAAKKHVLRRKELQVGFFKKNQNIKITNELNTGLVVFEPSQKIFKELIDTYHKYHLTKHLKGDQDIFNLWALGVSKCVNPLNSMWNFSKRHQNILGYKWIADNLSRIKLLHFVNCKPWYTSKEITGKWECRFLRLELIWWKYYAKSHFTSLFKTLFHFCRSYFSRIVILFFGSCATEKQMHHNTMKKTALFWPYKFNSITDKIWSKAVDRLIWALEKNNYEVLRHPNFHINKPERLKLYDFKKYPKVDLCIYNHADISSLTKNAKKAGKNLFFKPTVPEGGYATLDPIGYGPYSSIYYERPAFDSFLKEVVQNFYDTKVKEWTSNRSNKWNDFFTPQQIGVPLKDYYLIIGQCFGDEVVSRHEFGSYSVKLEQIIKELIRVDNKDILVKLHPYMSGKDKNTEVDAYVTSAKERLEKISDRVKVYCGNFSMHDFLENAYCVVLANSGAGFEAMMYNKPIISWGNPEYHWVTYKLVHLADMVRAVKVHEWFDEFKQQQFLYWYTQHYCYYDNESCERRLKQLI